jgi:hypothetical protein
VIVLALIHAGQNEIYEHDVAVLKKYSEDYHKIVLHKTLRKSGYEEESHGTGRGIATKNTVGNEKKLANSLSRSKAKIFELALCNDFEYFFTGTIDGNKLDRSDLDVYKKKLSEFINNFNRKCNPKVRYLLIPELHKDGKSWHMHGIISIPADCLVKFTSEDNIPRKMKEKIKKGYQFFNWPAYAKRFGFVSLEPIASKERVAKYITKYVNKALMDTRVKINDHVYFRSNGLNTAKTEYTGYLCQSLHPDFRNEFVAIKRVYSYEEGMSYFCD